MLMFCLVGRLRHPSARNCAAWTKTRQSAGSLHGNPSDLLPCAIWFLWFVWPGCNLHPCVRRTALLYNWNILKIYHVRFSHKTYEPPFHGCVRGKPAVKVFDISSHVWPTTTGMKYTVKLLMYFLYAATTILPRPSTLGSASHRSVTFAMAYSHYF